MTANLLDFDLEGLAAFWPNQPAGTPMVDYINSVPKFVVSKTLDEPLGWNNSALVEGDVAGAIHLEHGEEPADDLDPLGAVGDQLGERRPALAAQAA